MQRYFVDFSSDETTVCVTGDDVHHIIHVMRMKTGDTIYLSNQKQVFLSVIKEIQTDMVICDLQDEVINDSELPVQVTIAQGLPKGDKFEWIIQKTTELGVMQLIPVSSERSIIKLDQKREQKKIERYQKIAKEASEQSHRLKIPTITPVMSVKEMIKYSKNYNYKAVAYEATCDDDRQNLNHIIESLLPNDQLIVFIGPEGGISDKELNLLVEHGFKIISLGNRILRTETAGLFLMSAVVYQFEVKG